MQKSVLAGSLAMLALLTTWVAHGQEKQPLLDGMQAMEAASTAVDAKFGRGDSTVNGPDFDNKRGQSKYTFES